MPFKARGSGNYASPCRFCKSRVFTYSTPALLTDRRTEMLSQWHSVECVTLDSGEFGPSFSNPVFSVGPIKFCSGKIFRSKVMALFTDGCDVAVINSARLVFRSSNRPAVCARRWSVNVDTSALSDILHRGSSSRVCHLRHKCFALCIDQRLYRP